MHLQIVHDITSAPIRRAGSGRWWQLQGSVRRRDAQV